MRKAFTRSVAVLRGCEHGAQVEHQAIGILVGAPVGFAHGLFDQIQRIAADLRQLAGAAHLEASVRAAHLQRQLAPAHIVDAEMLVEQTNEGANGRRGVVVLGLAQQQRATALEVAQVEVVTQRAALGLAAAVDRQNHLGFRVVPHALGVQTDLGAQADGAHGLRFREDFGVFTDANFQVLRPDALV